MKAGADQLPLADLDARGGDITVTHHSGEEKCPRAHLQLTTRSVPLKNLLRDEPFPTHILLLRDEPYPHTYFYLIRLNVKQA